MKKILMLTWAVLSFFSTAYAQDVFFSGVGFNEFGKMTAVIYRNNELIYTQSSETMDQLGYGLTVNPNNPNDVFWEAIGGDQLTVANIYRNDELYVSFADDGFANKLYWYDSGTDDPNQSLYMLGRQKLDGDYYVAVWHGNEPTPLFMPDAGDGRESMAMDIIAVPGPSGIDLYYAGGREDESHDDKGTIWKNNEVLYTLDEPGVESFVVSMDYYDGDLYLLVYEQGENDASLNFYINETLQYSVVENTAENYVSSIRVDAGVVYVYVYYDQGVTKVWRDGELIYSHDGTFGEMFEAYNLAEVTSDGVYYVTLDYDEGQNEGQFAVYLNETAIQTHDVHELVLITAIDVVMECQEPDARALPYFEGFETGNTDWECWTVVDEEANCDENGVYRNSYWNRHIGRSTIYPVTGDYLAYHRWNDGATQEGWLVSPRLSIPSGSPCTLTFQSYEEYYNEMEYEGVWVSTTDDNPGSFTEVWSQTNPYDDWRLVEVDLSAYQGQAVYIAFKYAGFNGHSWYIDDVRVDAVAAVGEQKHQTLAVCPNPAKENIRIDGIENVSEFRIYNSLGELVKVVTAAPGQDITVSDLANGLYLVRGGNASLHFVKE